ncbi:MAG TPA: Stp1/IreP family PP2C-type Ser/Thr phosphatase [Myxococcota bacterium]|jgi:protein phosphatase|nr:Stp1/IreP family PP2C-type Ser/Thr phosphatase [Myxococcota bacterium]
MQLRAAAATDVGRRRRNNEDSFAVAPEHGLFLVADGMGGHTAGQVASDTAAKEVLAAIAAAGAGPTSPSERLRAAVTSANDAIFQMAKRKPELAGMGTTLVGLLTIGERAALAHVGDSRAYLVRRARVRQLTDDHSLVGELQRRGELTADAAQRHPHRHVLTRALGVRRGVEPDLAELSLTPGDVFVLCTDGLTTHVRDEEIAEIVEAEPDEQVAAKALVDLANERGGEDNVTVVIVKCRE